MAEEKPRAGWSDWALHLANALDSPPRLIGRCAAWLLLPMVGIIFFDVICRKFPRHLDLVIENDLHHFMNSPKPRDSEWHFSAALFFLSLGYATSMNVRIRLDLFRERMSAAARVGLELAGGAALWLPIVLLLAWYAGGYVWEAWESDEQSSFLTCLGNRWAIKSSLLVGLISLAMAVSSISLRAAVWLWGPAGARDACRLEAIAGTVGPPLKT